jgi:hypothetical protein
VTRPDVETVATAPSLVFQLIERPVRTLLLASLVTADSCAVLPTWRLAVAGDTDTDATGIGGAALTIRAEEALFPSLEAAIIAVPGTSAVMSPVGTTAATLELVLCHVMGRPTIGFPVESLSVAVACAV